MTHEPECQKADLGCGQYPCVEVCICEYLRAAYQRGREDAVKALIDLPSAAWGENLSPLNFEAIFGAARGESADEDKPECWDCESCSDPDCGCIGCGVARVDGAE